MIRYYAYYNHGGYKDFYLGNSEDQDLSRYYFPLLPIHEQSLAEQPDEELERLVERQKRLPQLIYLSDLTTKYNYPDEARRLMSHAGYKMLYREVDGTLILSLRDIAGEKDAYGRQTPFNVMLVGDRSEKMRLDRITGYIRENLSDVEEQIRQLLFTDYKENGLRFDLSAFNLLLEEMVSSAEPYLVDETLRCSVWLLVVYPGTNLENTLREQAISRRDLYACYDTSGRQLLLTQHLSGNLSEQPIRPRFETMRSGQKMEEIIENGWLVYLEKMLKKREKKIDSMRELINHLEDRLKKLEQQITELKTNYNQTNKL